MTAKPLNKGVSSKKPPYHLPPTDLLRFHCSATKIDLALRLTAYAPTRNDPARETATIAINRHTTALFVRHSRRAAFRPPRGQRLCGIIPLHNPDHHPILFNRRCPLGESGRTLFFYTCPPRQLHALQVGSSGKKRYPAR